MEPAGSYGPQVNPFTRVKNDGLFCQQFLGDFFLPRIFGEAFVCMYIYIYIFSNNFGDVFVYIFCQQFLLMLLFLGHSKASFIAKSLLDFNGGNLHPKCEVDAQNPAPAR